MKTITVLLVDGNVVVRRAFKELLELEDDLEVVGGGSRPYPGNGGRRRCKARAPSEIGLGGAFHGFFLPSHFQSTVCVEH